MEVFENRISFKSRICGFLKISRSIENDIGQMCVFSWQLFYTCLLYFSSLIILIIIIYVSRRIYVRLNFKAICLHILYKNIFSFCFLSINIYEEKLVVGRLYSSWKVLKILFMRNLCKNEHDFDF